MATPKSKPMKSKGDMAGMKPMKPMMKMPMKPMGGQMKRKP